MKCAQCQLHLWDYLYDLLEDDTLRQGITAHVRTCADCGQVWAAVQTRQQLLARAARAEGVAITFTAPRDEPTSEPVDVAANSHLTRPILPPEPRRSWGRFLVPFAVAAGLLLALGAAFFTLQQGRYEAALAQAQGRKQEAEAKLRTLAQEKRQRQQAYDLLSQSFLKLSEEERQAVEKLRHERAGGQFYLTVSGNRAYEAGAPNTLRVKATDLADRPVAAELQVALLDQTRQPLGAGPRLQVRPVQPGEFLVEFPRDFTLPVEQELYVEVLARAADGTRQRVVQPVKYLKALYLTHLVTDKPMYQPGETVRFRSLTLDRFTFQSVRESLTLDFAIISPRGEQVFRQSAPAVVHDPETKQPLTGPDGQALQGVGCGEFKLPDDLKGGEYTVQVREKQDRFQPQQRRFLVNRYEKHRLLKQLEYTKASHGLGEEVIALCKVAAAEGGQPLAGQPVQATLNVDGKLIALPETRTDAQGGVTIKATLPREIHRGDVTLTVIFTDGANRETLVKPVPLALNRLYVQLFPEGGDLVAGVPNRVYFHVRTVQDKPANLRAKLVDAAGTVVATPETFTDPRNPGANQGVGAFTFTPERGKQYRMQPEQPVGVSLIYEFPKITDNGIVLHLPQTTTQGSDPLHVVLHNRGADKRVLVGAYCRGHMLAHQTATLAKDDTATVDLKVEQPIGGVLRVTVFEERAFGSEKLLVPVAERLTYRPAPRALNVSLTPQRSRYFPGERASLQVQTTNEKNATTPALVMLAVVDKAVLAMADEKSARSLPTFFLLTNELRKPDDLEHTDFLLSDHPHALKALDFLLGTQGWRRFAEQDPQEFRSREKAEADRFLAQAGQTPVLRSNRQEVLQQVDTAIQGELRQTQAAFAQKKATLNQEMLATGQAMAAVIGPQGQAEEQRLRQEQTQALAALAAVTTGQETFRESFWSVAWLLAVVVGLAVLAYALVASLQQRLERVGKYGLLRGLQVASILTLAGTGLVVAYLFGDRLLNLARMPQLPGWTDVGAVDQPRAGQPAQPEKGPGHMAQGDGKGAPPPLAAHAERGPRPQPPIPDQARLPRELPGDQALRRLQPGAGHGQEEAVAKKRPVEAEPFVVRQYAHARRHGTSQERSDFSETLYWHPFLLLPDGRGNVSFDLCDSVTTFQATAYAVSFDGRLGAAALDLQAKLPFSIEPKIPVEVTATDRIDIPVALANGTDDRREVQVRARADGLTLVGPPDQRLTLAAQQKGRVLYRFQPSLVEGEARLHLEGSAGTYTDSIQRTCRVVPDGFPILGARSDLLERTATQEILLPSTWIKGSLKLRAQVYPSTLAELQKGLEGMLREPHGCFEQASSTNYPNALTLNYLREAGQADPATAARARELLTKGYDKLLAYECDVLSKQEGFEWFGGKGVMPHEALTAYGLMQFADMARVHPVDETLLKRTRTYLLTRRDGKGGFQRNPKALDQFGRAPEPITNAYILWALTETGPAADVTAEVALLKTQAAASSDPYFLALVANVLLNADQKAEAVALLQKLVRLQQADGHLAGTEMSITGSTGRDLRIETTALALLGWLKANRPAEFTAAIQNGVKWLNQQRGGHGSFGATQSTVLALKALIAFTRSQKRMAEAGELTLYVNGRAVGKVAFSAQQQEALEILLPDAEEVLKPGKNDVRLEITTQSPIPYTLAWSYRTLQPANTPECAVQVATKLDRTEATEGETVRLSVTLKNISGKGQGMAMAVIGLPAGLTLPEDMKQLKDHARLLDEDTRPGRIAAFEVQGRELVLYWRDLAPNATVELPVDLVCRVPGSYRGPASRAYLYYNADHKHWAAPLQIQIKAVP